MAIPWAIETSGDHAMTYKDELYDLAVQIHTRHYDLAAAERASLEACLGSLSKLVSRFPGASLHVDIARHPRAKDFHVKTSLRLAGRTLFTGERDPLLHRAYERCVRKLMHKAKAYREKLERKPTIEKEVQGTLHTVVPDREPDAPALESAVRDGDFARFRTAAGVYDGALGKRIHDRLARYVMPAAIQAAGITEDDVLEEVYLNAFEGFPGRPRDRVGNWFESLIDPSLRALLEHPEAEKENLGYVREAGSGAR
jgi:ribosome-associated translation inhibitor RaiA